MKPSKLALHSPVIIPLLFAALGASVISTWVTATRSARHASKDASDDTQSAIFERIHDRMHILTRMNTTNENLARIIGSTPSENLTSFSDIENKVAPRLFFTFAMNEMLSHISYADHNGLLYSFHNEDHQTKVIFSNTSFYSNSSSIDHLYIQSVDPNYGMRYGNATAFPLQARDLKWIINSLNGKSGHASWEFGFANDQNLLFMTTTKVGNGALTLGVAVKHFTDFVTGINLHGSHLYLAMEDGRSLTQTGPPYVQYVVKNATVLVKSGGEFVNVACPIDTYSDFGFVPGNNKHLNIQGEIYTFGCAIMNASGVKLVSVMALPCKGTIHTFQIMNIIVISLLVLWIFGTVIGTFIVLQLFRKTRVMETSLCANLIKQKEAIQQAERKSMNKSLAFASASHDIRTSLAGITGLIDLCRGDVPFESKIDKNLVQMNGCAMKLLGILNSVLDTSKVEAGKMQLDEEEFDMAQVLEESIDIVYVVARKKGLEIIWDPCDCSILKLSNVKGDCRRFKQIMDNLLSNAVKFTSQGQVVVRAWAKKSCIVNFKISSRHRYHFSKMLDSLSHWFCKDGDIYSDLDNMNPIQHDPRSIEFVFEVDDTGIGVPKEKRASVFENYVQVKESIVEGQEGTGLGLGIVQSYVRLMGGEISIKDKEPGERGTCFRFSILLKSSETPHDVEGQVVSSTNQVPSEVKNASRLNLSHKIQHGANQSKIRGMVFNNGLKVEGMNAMLLLQGEETRKVMQKWLERLGMRVWILQHLDFLYPAHEKIMHRFLNNLSSSGKQDVGPLTISNRSGFQCAEKERPTIGNNVDANDQTLTRTTTNSSNRGSKGFFPYLLIVLDISCGNCSEMCSIVRKLSASFHNVQHKFVWLANSDTPRVDMRRVKEAPYDLILQKPLHGSRLYEVLRLLQDCESITGLQIESKVQVDQQCSKSGLPKITINKTEQRAHSTNFGHPDNDKPLAGMNVLLVEDTKILRHLASTKLSRLGANIEFAENGLEALNLVNKVLQGDRKDFAYDVILMDCEMPIMNGYEATREIRKEEKYYGIHIPIIALTAHASPEEEQKTKLSGMDFHLTKPLQDDKLVEALQSLCPKLTVEV